MLPIPLGFIFSGGEYKIELPFHDFFRMFAVILSKNIL